MSHHRTIWPNPRRDRLRPAVRLGDTPPREIMVLVSWQRVARTVEKRRRENPLGCFREGKISDRASLPWRPQRDSNPPIRPSRNARRTARRPPSTVVGLLTNVKLSAFCALV